MALQVLDWNPEEATVVREGRLFCLAPDSNNWTRRGRSLKMMTVHVLLITLGTVSSTKLCCTLYQKMEAECGDSRSSKEWKDSCPENYGYY